MLSCLAISVQGCHGPEPSFILLDCRFVISFPAGSGEEYVGEGNSGVLHGMVHLFARESIGFPRRERRKQTCLTMTVYGYSIYCERIETDMRREEQQVGS
jgi:hypothetical protein